MKDSKLNRWKVLLASTGSITLFYGINFYASQELYFTLQSLLSNAEVVEINVYGLWIPIGTIGLLLFVAAAFIVAFKTRKKADQVWGNKGQKIVVRVTGFFAILGLFFAIGTYQWLTAELDDRGYIYSEEESSLSAMGKHEVYIKP